MELIPTEEEVIELLRSTGGLRRGHFEYPNGLHSDHYLQVPITMRHSAHARLLCVALARKLRQHTEIRAMAATLSIVTPATGGLPVAYGVCDALRAQQVYWAERAESGGPLRFRPHLEPAPGEKVLLVDDILRSGKKLTELKALIESKGADVVGLAVIIHQPTPHTPDFGALPFYYLAKLNAMYYMDGSAVEAASLGSQPEKVWI